MGEEVKGSSSSSFRWNPTKEQVAILEGIYREGVRTPSAEQIQEITRRLRAFGEIQGKNVFYWFQNHKARHRQKIKHDDRLALLARLRRRHPPPPPPNVVYAPYGGIPVVVPQPAGASSGFYYQTPAATSTTTPRTVYMPGGPPAARMSMAKKLEGSSVGQQYSHSPPVPMHETLQLFPLQPSSTGVLPEEEIPGLASSPASAASVVLEEEEEEEETVPFFNFFAPSGGN